MIFCRTHMRPQENYADHAPPEVVGRNGRRFEELIGLHVPYGWTTDPPNERIRAARAGRTIHA